MKLIKEEDLIKTIRNEFPKFIPYWDSYIEDFGSDLGIHLQMMPFENFSLDVLKSNNEFEIKKIFDFIETLLCKGDESVQNAITTSFLEYLLSKDPEEINFKKFVNYLGERTLEYCRAWNKFTGVKTEGL